VSSSGAALPDVETRGAFIAHYAAGSSERLAALRTKPAVWFLEPTKFFDTQRTRAWVLARRLTHSAHHRGQLSVYFRLWGQPLYSTFGPTADTGGLPKDAPATIYPYGSIDDLLDAAANGRAPRSLPVPTGKPVTERPDP
jgi:hypothetical protein